MERDETSTTNSVMQANKYAIALIDNRREYGQIPVCASCVTISNPQSISSSETGINPEIKS